MRMRHEHARHDREMERHVALVAVAEIGDGVFRPLIRFRQQHPVRYFASTCARSFFRNACVSGRFSQFVPSRSIQIRNRRPDETRPRPCRTRNRSTPCTACANVRVVEVQIGLVRIEAMPVISLRDRIPGPVGSFEILEDDARLFVFLRRVAPDVEIAPA